MHVTSYIAVVECMGILYGGMHVTRSTSIANHWNGMEFWNGILEWNVNPLQIQYGAIFCYHTLHLASYVLAIATLLIALINCFYTHCKLQFDKGTKIGCQN